MMGYVIRHPRYREFGLTTAFDPPRGERLKDLVGLGLPIGVSVVSEAGLFSAVALLMGSLGATAVAAHQIATNSAATMSMVPLAFHSALTIRVGHVLGRGDARTARRIGFIGIAMCGVVMTVSALVLLAFRQPIASFYTVDPEVRGLAVSLLTMGMLFQIFDGLQVGAAGALRRADHAGRSSTDRSAASTSGWENVKPACSSTEGWTRWLVTEDPRRR